MRPSRYYACDCLRTLIGAGGWDYFRVGGDRLKAYAGAFELVEVNSTFYGYPSEKAVSGWRARVPDDFEFSVRCNRELTHGERMRPSERSLECLRRMTAVCRTLRSKVLVLQTPASFVPDEMTGKNVRDLLGSAGLGNLRLAWELRCGTARVPHSLLGTMSDLGVVHCADLSREGPAYPSDILYTRLFGKGFHNIHRFSDEELEEVDGRGRGSGAMLAFFVMHGTRMYMDAARLKLYRETGEFPRAPGVDGASGDRRGMARPCL